LPAGAGLKLVPKYLLPCGLSDEALAALQADEQKTADFLRGKTEYLGKSEILNAVFLPEDSTVLERLLKKEIVVCNYDAVRRIGDAGVKMARLAEGYDEVRAGKISKKQDAVIRLLSEAGTASVKEICYFTGVTAAVPGALAKKGILEIYSRAVYRTPKVGVKTESAAEIALTQEQQTALFALRKKYEEGGVALLYGVTGSGKTSVFLKLIEEVVALGRGVIVMVPEISLTPQTLAVFRAKFEGKIAVLHSALSLGERMDEWKRVKNGEAQIVVGTRSAVFAPLSDIGLIIMDEEQEYTYQSESAPRYHARDVAKVRAANHKGLLVLSSATPSLESFAAAKSGRYALCTLKRRYGGAVLPEVSIADMREELRQGNKYAVSRVLLAALEENCQKKQQSILLINRRGYNTFVTCSACGDVVSCPNCSISMTYHSANNRLMCHYCGHSRPFKNRCEKCGANSVNCYGIGTQRVEEQLRALLPQARILRLDTDTTMAKDSHERFLSAFGKREYDVLLGTQMVAKGLDFENVTLVGVISADQQLYDDDYRSSERTFDLLTQVVGRSGRGDFRGKAVIQTMTPENTIIALAAKQDYEAFFESEMKIRKALVYPPFCEICCVNFIGGSAHRARSAAEVFLQRLKTFCKDEYDGQKFIALGPHPPRLAKVNNKFGFRIILKCKNTARFRQMISTLLTEFGKSAGYPDVAVYINNEQR
jgi:primosomal protein N' (replication factor Y)